MQGADVGRTSPAWSSGGRWH